MLIYNYSAINNYFTGVTQDIPNDAGIPPLWTDEPVPSIPAGEWARYNNPGWVVTDVPPPMPPEQPVAPAAEGEQPVAQPGEAPTVI
jgi:hypothetical protein